jgi:predicted nucleic acid-binding protein
MVVFDSSFLLLLLDPDAGVPLDPQTQQPVADAKVRIEHRIEVLSKARTTIVIPTPVLSEVFVRVGDQSAINEYMGLILNSYRFEVGKFDVREAVEVAMLTDDDLASGRLRTENETKAKVKYDRQIIAIAKVRGAKTIYSGDGNMAAVAERSGIRTVLVSELPLPPKPPQVDFINDD